MKMPTGRARLGLVLVAPLLLSRTLAAGDLPTDFYKAKRKSTSIEAYERTHARLRDVRIGMPEDVFFEAVALGVLSHRGVPRDAMLDGFLVESTRALNASGDPESRSLVFGFVKKGREVVRSRIVLRKHRVSEIVLEVGDADLRAARDESQEGGAPSSPRESASTKRVADESKIKIQ